MCLGVAVDLNHTMKGRESKILGEGSLGFSDASFHRGRQVGGGLV